MNMDSGSKGFCIKCWLFVHAIPERSKRMDLDKVVCYCQNITNGMIKDAVDGGADTLEEVQEVTGAGTVCGGCVENIRHLVDQFVQERE